MLKMELVVYSQYFEGGRDNDDGGKTLLFLGEADEALIIYCIGFGTIDSASFVRRHSSKLSKNIGASSF